MGYKSPMRALRSGMEAKRVAGVAYSRQIGATSSDIKGTNAFNGTRHLKSLAAVMLPSTPRNSPECSFSHSPTTVLPRLVSEAASSPTSIVPPRISRLTCVDVR